MDPELKKLLDELKGAYSSFRQSNDEMQAQIKALGAADATTAAAVEKSNAAITALEERIEAQTKALRDIETAQARAVPAAGSEARDREEQHAREFKALRTDANAQQIAELVVDHADIQALRDYKRAFTTFLRRDEKALTPEIRAALQVGTQPDGGQWVPPDLSGRMVQMIYESSPMRQVASVQSIGSDALEGTYDNDEADSGWVGETSSRSETSTPKVGEWRIVVQEQYAAPKATQKAIDDSIIDIEGWLGRKVADKMARRENTGYVVGDGVKQPRGFTTYAEGVATKTDFGKIEVVKTGVNGAFHATTPADVFIDTIGALKESYLPNSRWAMKRTTKTAVRKIKDGDGNYLLLPDFRDGFQERLLGFPVIGFEDMATIATNSLSIAFGDFREAYQIVDRLGIRVLRDPYTNKPWVIFYSTKRTGGGIVNYEALKLIKFAA